MRKGTTLLWLGPGNAEAGWGFNSDYDVLAGYDPENYPIRDHMPPAQANVLPDAAIQTNSFFYPFDDQELYSEAGNAFLLNGEMDVRNSTIYRRLLADAIPSLLNPASRNSLDYAVQGNRDYMSYGGGTGFRRARQGRLAAATPAGSPWYARRPHHNANLIIRRTLRRASTR